MDAEISQNTEQGQLSLEPPLPPHALPAIPRTRTRTGPGWQAPAAHIDVMPEGTTGVSDSEDEPDEGVEPSTPSRSRITRLTLIVRDKLDAVLNRFNLVRKYLHRPLYDPDGKVVAEDLSNIGQPLTKAAEELHSAASAMPQTHTSASLLVGWQNTGSNLKSDGEVDRLVHEVLRDPEFKLEDFSSRWRTRRENQRLDAADQKPESTPFGDGFIESTVEIIVPSGDPAIPPRPYAIPGLRHRPLISVIKAAFADPLAKKFHMSPFKLYQKIPGSDDARRVYSELYNSDAFIEEHDRVQRAPVDDPSCKLEKVVAAMMFWSDSTHLTSFGSAKLWPLYAYFGNLSQYINCAPTSGSCHHVAYFPSLPDRFGDFGSSFHVKWGTQKSEIVTHCRRELMHAVWRLLLDDDFLHAYTYGIVVQCADGVQRRIYPRIFTYSADYPEKCVLWKGTDLLL